MSLHRCKCILLLAAELPGRAQVRQHPRDQPSFCPGISAVAEHRQRHPRHGCLLLIPFQRDRPAGNDLHAPIMARQFAATGRTCSAALESRRELCPRLPAERQHRAVRVFAVAYHDEGLCARAPRHFEAVAVGGAVRAFPESTSHSGKARPRAGHQSPVRRTSMAAQAGTAGTRPRGRPRMRCRYWPMRRTRSPRDPPDRDACTTPSCHGGTSAAGRTAYAQCH